jgi:hypothetical protein
MYGKLFEYLEDAEMCPFVHRKKGLESTFTKVLKTRHKRFRFKTLLIDVPDMPGNYV